MLTDNAASCIDDCFKNRWRTLMSVDDAIKDTIEAVDQLGQSNNTYFLYSSEPPDSETLCKSQTEKPCCGCAGDHGFQLGELNLPQDKRNVYDFDIRIHRASRALLLLSVHLGF